MQYTREDGVKALVFEGPRKVVVKEMPDARIERHAPEGYENFDERNEGWTKVVLKPAA